MSIKFNYTAHKEIWIWIAQNPKKYKLASKLAWRIAHLKVREGVECV